MHLPVAEQGQYLRAVVTGHMRYYGVPRNRPRLNVFRREVAWLWLRTLRRCSQSHRLPLRRMHRLVARWLPLVRICHPQPGVRFAQRYVLTQGNGRMR